MWEEFLRSWANLGNTSLKQIPKHHQHIFETSQRTKTHHQKNIRNMKSADPRVERVEHLAYLPTYLPYPSPPTYLPIYLPTYESFFLPNFLPFLFPFFFSSFLPNLLPPGGRFTSPLPPSWHQPGMRSGTRASSEPTCFDANFRIFFLWHVGNLFIPQSSKSLSKNDPEWLPKSIQEWSEN